MAWLAPLHNWSHRRWGNSCLFLFPCFVNATRWENLRPHENYWGSDNNNNNCCSFFYWNRKGMVLNTKKICLEKVNSISIIRKDMPLIQGRETGPGTNHGSPRPEPSIWGSSVADVPDVCFSNPQEFFCLQLMRWKAAFSVLSIINKTNY